MTNFTEGANKAWATRRARGWKRRTNAQWKVILLKKAESEWGGRGTKRMLNRARKLLTKRFRSKAQERKIIKEYREEFGL